MMQNQQLTIIPYLTTVCGLHAKKKLTEIAFDVPLVCECTRERLSRMSECHHQCMDVCVIMMCDVNRKSREVVYKLNPSTIYISTEKNHTTTNWEDLSLNRLPVATIRDLHF